MVKINGTAADLAGQTVAQYLAQAGWDAARLAVERNGDIVPGPGTERPFWRMGTFWRSSALWGVVNLHASPSREDLRLAREARHGPALQGRFSAASVAVCGLGGLGSNLALCLARAGVGWLHLIDFDRVELSNLHRQQYFATQLGQPKTEALRDILAAAAPDVTVTIHTARVPTATWTPSWRTAKSSARPSTSRRTRPFWSTPCWSASPTNM